jgi:hypothetical protein
MKPEVNEAWVNEACANEALGYLGKRIKNAKSLLQLSTTLESPP